MGMAAPVYYTADMVRALPEDGNRYETVYGELLVTPAPRAWHQIVVKRLLVQLELYTLTEHVGFVLQSPADISWSDHILVQPDLFVVDSEEARTMDWTRMKTLPFVIEVLSPSTTRYDRFTKRRLYQDVNIPAYWIVDADKHQVEVWTPEAEVPRLETERVTWSPPGSSVPFTVELAELFRAV
jgi:Uma2 family endonuclease